MSGRGGRGGRGGGRGGRGGGKPAPPGLPGFDNETNMLIQGEPQETYPKTYKPPLAPGLTASEERGVASFVAFRRAFRDTPLYTHRHMITVSETETSGGPTAPMPRTYGRAQANARYAVKTRATVDPFLAVPMYSHQFVDEARALPDLRGRPYVKDFFPEELWATLDGKDKGGAKGGFKGGAGEKEKQRARTKRSRGDGAIVDVDDPFADLDDIMDRHSKRRAGQQPETEEERKKRIEEAVAGDRADGEEGEPAEVDLDEEEAEMTQEDDDYEDDEDGGDYDAEQYFDDGADNDMEDEGVGESAMDF
ncbi:hypothetical protein DL769_009583 [Monosporascus sp. CRB-8-3]|nr:hypothetical protein DL769_009583 [Monosporascus sp. CRB-8-3]